MEKHVTCIATGEQQGNNRFPNDLAPSLCAWRCDLTAFSQRHNLYFLASTNTIQIYKPGFPDQNLAAEADLILHPPETGHRGLGIDPWEPHSINRILIEYLGNEEVLLVACDDGDVIGYRTEVIHRALERPNQGETATEDDVHVFLHRNVGASAWGLAVHQEARIIAISANTYQVTVIAYALAHHTEEGDTLDDDDVSESSRPIPQFPFWRQKETVFTLSATNNLPALSFYHSSGRWLLSSCIDGKTILWDLHTRRAAATYQLGWCISAKDLSSPPSYGSRGFTCACPAASNVLHGAWGTMALDTQAAYYLPPEEEQKLGSREVSDVFRDVSAQKKSFTVENRHTRIPFMELSESEDEISDFEDEDSVQGQTQEAQPPESPQADGGFSQMFSQQIIQNIFQGHQNIPDLPDFISNMIPLNRAPLAPSLALKPYCAVIKDRQFVNDKSAEEELNIPFIIVTKEDIFLIQRPFATNMQNPSNRIVSMQRPLHPGEWVPSLPSQDRHCFYAQISELGVFIVASPIGRAAVFSLYWTKDRGSPRRRYGFKLEYLLPFKAENENQIAGVPLGRLIGVAVSPIQGMFDTPRDVTENSELESEHGGGSGGGVQQPRRWRLLMHYMDHTILSFELSKPRRASESPGLGDLVV